MKHPWLEKLRLIIALSPEKLTLLLFIIVSTLLLFWQITSYLLEPSYSATEQCEQKKLAIEQRLGDASHCGNDSDCVPFKANCPFNCRAVSKREDTALLMQQLQAYGEQCGMCVSSCVALVLRCVNHRCIVQ